VDFSKWNQNLSIEMMVAALKWFSDPAKNQTFDINGTIVKAKNLCDLIIAILDYIKNRCTLISHKKYDKIYSSLKKFFECASTINNMNNVKFLELNSKYKAIVEEVNELYQRGELDDENYYILQVFFWIWARIIK